MKHTPSPHRTAASTLAQRLRIVAHRGHQVTAKDLATLVRAAALLEEQGAEGLPNGIVGITRHALR
ncbi:MAG: hypothetical protein INF98_06105 [Roseomonas sp.]|nr:hypothetical protein [Roseomonas sp.]